MTSFCSRGTKRCCRVPLQQTTQLQQEKINSLIGINAGGKNTTPKMFKPRDDCVQNVHVFYTFFFCILQKILPSFYLLKTINKKIYTFKRWRKPTNVVSLVLTQTITLKYKQNISYCSYFWNISNNFFEYVDSKVYIKVFQNCKFF